MSQNLYLSLDKTFSVMANESPDIFFQISFAHNIIRGFGICGVVLEVTFCCDLTWLCPRG